MLMARSVSTASSDIKILLVSEDDFYETSQATVLLRATTPGFKAFTTFNFTNYRKKGNARLAVTL